MILVLWDIDRTLLYAGDTDRLVYREVFRTVVGRPATKLPAKATGVTMPVAVRELLAANGVPEVDRVAPSSSRASPPHCAATGLSCYGTVTSCPARSKPSQR
ncbi:hypothetical protein [Streptomyces sp. NRRL F-5630]|uniref:hypothetical protein n=1 Tax=Streptomyces sp. NRRL F-5630 TaxID=1463864 RepID=UPI003EBE8725